MKRVFVIFSILMIIIFILSSCSEKNKVEFISPEAGTHHLSFEHDDHTRTYILYLPEDLPQNAPLVFVLHGYTMTAEEIISFGMNDIADANGFAICYPQGTVDAIGNTHWNARLSISTINDIDFLGMLAKKLQVEYSLDPQKTFSCGFSNGGFMSYTLACEKSDVFKAVASVAGTMSGYTWNNRDNAEPIPILHIHGVDDIVVPIDGSLNTIGGWGGAPPVSEIVEFWVKLNDCKEIETAILNENIEATYYKNGIYDNEVWYLEINNWGHLLPEPNSEIGILASETIWNFFDLTFHQK